MNVLSLFDGSSCGQIALNRAGIKYDKYYASEIDKYAIEITQKNYPNTIQIGDVVNVKSSDLPKIDLLMGGSPCQGFSQSGKELNFQDPRSKLFFEYVRLLKELKPKYFLLENVTMKTQWVQTISEYLQVPAIEIDSSIFSAQLRPRIYWTNIPIAPLPKDKGITNRKILEKNVVREIIDQSDFIATKNYKNYLHFSRTEICKKHQSQHARAWRLDSKHGCLAVGGGKPKILMDDGTIEVMTIIEAERLQTVPDNYTEGVSLAQRHKMLGNGWTVDVIVFLLEGIQNKTRGLF